MKEKLTLTIEKETKERVRQFARKQGTSISKLVEDYLAAVSAKEGDTLYQIGKKPVKTGVEDASEEHDRYLYSQDK